MEITRHPDVPLRKRRFVPADFDGGDAASVQSAAERLLDQPIGSPDDLGGFLRDWSELASFVWGVYTRLRTATTRNTADEASQERLQAFVNNVLSRWHTIDDRLNRHFLECEHRAGLNEDYGVLRRNREKAAEIFREENTDLAVEDLKIGTEYQKVRGAQVIRVGDEELTPPQALERMRENDRGAREEVFRAWIRARTSDAERIHVLYDKVVRLRHTMARNAGFENYRDYRFAQLNRFDYTAEDCARFHDAAERVAKPYLAEVFEMRRKRLGLEALRPYDMFVGLFDSEPRKVFEDQRGLVRLGRSLFHEIDPSFAQDFDVLVRNGLLDLMSRPGKAPGAYNASVDDIGLPFVFGNAVGTPTDLRTLLHEGGHAFHTIACRDIELIDYRRPPTEFCEVASMSMELFGLERMERVHGADEAREQGFEFLSNLLSLFGRVAQMDAFQHWVYENPGHSHDERNAKWVELSDRFLEPVDWSGYEDARAIGWQMVPHLFTHPLYYIEYGIAQLGALQLWRNEREDHEKAVDAYRRGLALGGSRPLPELFETAGARFAMDEDIFREVLPDVAQRLRALAPDADSSISA